jgi:hypothetical protein
MKIIRYLDRGENVKYGYWEMTARHRPRRRCALQLKSLDRPADVAKILAPTRPRRFWGSD